MKKLILFLWITLHSITSLTAQTNQDSIKAYNKVKKWAVVKLTIAFMEDMYSFSPDKKGGKGTNEEYNTYKILFDEYYNFKTGVDLNEVSDILKKGEWSGADKKEFAEYRKELIDSDHNNDFSFIKYTPERTYEQIPIGTENRAKAISHIQTKYEEVLREYNSNINDSIFLKDQIDTAENNYESTVDEKDILSVKEQEIISDNYNRNRRRTSRQISSNRSFMSTLGWVLLIFSCFINVTLYLNYKKIKEKYSKRKYSNVGSNRLTNEDLIIGELKRKNSKLEEDNQNLKRELEELKNSNIKQVDDSSNEPIEHSLMHKPALQQPTKKTLYLSSPFQDSIFANEDSNTEQTSNSLYRVCFNEQSQTGELSIIEDSDLSKALNSPETYLEKACIYDNEYTINARGVKVVEKGEVELAGEDWIVTKKILIKFI